MWVPLGSMCAHDTKLELATAVPRVGPSPDLNEVVISRHASNRGRPHVQLAKGSKPTPYRQVAASGRFCSEPRHEVSERQHIRRLGADGP